MSRNWIRACQLIVSGSAGKKNLGSLRVVFAIKQWHLQAPNMASFRVYNPSPTTRAQLRAKEFTQVQFYAGYQDNVGLVYSGEIKQTANGHETAVDSYVDIFCADGESGYNRARVNQTLAAGWSPQDKLNAAMQSMQPFGVTLGLNTIDMSQPKFPRGIPLVGMARDIIRQVVTSKGGLWSTQLGQVKITDKTMSGGSSAPVVLNEKTGLVGWPRQTQDGILVRSLLNPALQPLMQIKLDPSGIIEAERDNNPLSQTGPSTNLNLDQQALGAGTYTIFHMDRFGDTWGTDWFDESMCIGQGGSLPPSGSNQGYYLGGGEAVQQSGGPNNTDAPL